MMRKYLVVLLILIIITFTAACTFPPASDHQLPAANNTPAGTHPSGNLTVHFIDVGMGDSELIQTPSGRTMLIDAGDSDHGEIITAYLKKLRIDTLDVVVVSNPGNNIIGGMPEILNTVTVGKFIDNGDPLNSKTKYYNSMFSLIEQKNISYRTVKAGDTIPLDPAITINVLNPQSIMSHDYTKNSVVLKTTYGNTSFLFMGDAWGDVENTIAESAGHADILKVGYHGNSISTSSAFLAKVKPSVSVIEGFTTQFGDCSPETIQRLQDSGSMVYVTYVNGTIKVVSAGNIYSVITEL